MRLLYNETIVGHVHDEVIIEAEEDASVSDIATQMANVPNWMKDIFLRADGYECDFYQKIKKQFFHKLEELLAIAIIYKRFLVLLKPS